MISSFNFASEIQFGTYSGEHWWCSKTRLDLFIAAPGEHLAAAGDR